MPLFTSDHMFERSLSFQAIHLNAQLLTLMIVKILWFIYINAVFAPHIDRVRSYSKHLYENKGRIRDGPLEKFWGGGEFSSRRNFFSSSNSL